MSRDTPCEQLELEYSLTFTNDTGNSILFEPERLSTNGLGTWRSKHEQKNRYSKQNFASYMETVFFLPVDPRNESHRDPEYIDFSVPRLARYMHRRYCAKAKPQLPCMEVMITKRHQDAVFWVDIDLGIKEGILSNKIECNYSSRNTAQCMEKTSRYFVKDSRNQRRTYKIEFFKEHSQPIVL